MIRALKVFLKAITGSVRDLASIVIVLLLFQYLVLQQPLPDPGAMLAGFLCVVLGLTLFVYGLDMALFPAGEGLANGFAHKGAVFFQTQAIYDPAHFVAFAERIAPLGVRLLAGILPIKSERMARHMNDKVPDIDIPEPMIEEIRSADDVKAVSRHQAAEVIRQIREACAGVHVMALGWEDQIPAILEEAGIVR